MIYLRRVFIIVLFLAIIFFAKNIEAQVVYEIPRVIINEVMWAGSTYSSSDEWIELYNTTDEDIDISGWQIANARSSGKSIIIPKDKEYIIPAEGFFLISKYNNDQVNCILDLSPDIIISGLSLANSGNGDLILIDQDGVNIDVAPGNPWPAGNNDKKYSMERTDIFDPLVSGSWQDSRMQINLKENLIFATPGAQNSPTLFYIPDNINNYLNEYIYFENSLLAEAYVEDVIDGDTIKVIIQNEHFTVRLIGIDSPEKGQNYFQEAVNYALENMYDEYVQILVPADISQRFDIYGRLLGTIIIDDRIINTELLSIGLAKTYYLDNPLVIRLNWEYIEQQAKENYLGIWNIDHDMCLRISEFMANPEGEDTVNEWVEIYNFCERNVNLSGWYIDDDEGGSKAYQISEDLIIPPNSYYVFYSSKTKISLNNDKDHVRILNPNNIVIDDVYYENPPDSQSYAIFDVEWMFGVCPTPGNTNQYCSAQKADYKQVENIEELSFLKDEKVAVSGIVNSLPGNFSTQYFYIQDDTGGVQIYSQSGEFVPVDIGDYITVYGTKSDTNYFRVRYTQDDFIEKIDKNYINSKNLLINQVSKNHQGQLVTIVGIIANKYKDYFLLKSNNYEIKIDIKNDQIDLSKFHQFDAVSITGIVYLSSQGNLSILPRLPTDIIYLGGMGGNNFINNIDNIAQTYFLRDQEIIKISGFVNSLPGTVDARYFYIQDSSGAIAIYNTNKDFPQLNIGDKVEIFGVYDKKYNRIKIDNQTAINILESNYVIFANDYNFVQAEESIGMLVSIEGTITKKQSGKLFMQTSMGQFTIYLRSFCGLKSSNFKVGDYIKIQGILKDYSDEFRLVPRNPLDLLIHYKLSPQSTDKKITNNTKLNKMIKSAKAAPADYISKNSIKSIDKSPKNIYNYSYLIFIIILLQTFLIYVVSKK